MKRPYLSLVVAAALLVLTPFSNVHAQDSEADLRSEIEQLKKGQEKLGKEIQEIRKLLQARAAAAPSGPNVEGTVFDLGDNPVKGESTAKLTLVEFTDYQ